MIDSHCHIDLSPFDNDREQVIASAREQGVTRLMVPGLYLNQFQTILGLKREHSNLDIALGFHPYFLENQNTGGIDDSISALASLVEAERDKVCAIGETGLDNVINFPIDVQIAYLERQLHLANKLGLPVILHHRKSHNELIRLIKNTKFDQGGVIHAFSGSAQVAKTYVNLGFKLGIGGTITYARSNKTRKAIESVGLEHLLLETDAPDMPVYGYQGKRNSPTQLPLIADSLAKLLDLDLSEVSKITTENYHSLFFR